MGHRPTSIAAACALAPACCGWSTPVELWQLGDVEQTSELTGQLTPYPDEFNYQGELGLFAEFPDPFVVGEDPVSDFPWNSNVSEGYAVDFEIAWQGAARGGGRLTVSWSPGGSGSERMVLTLVETGDDASFTALGGHDEDGWLDYPLERSVFEFPELDEGWHTLRVEHTSGNGSIFDWLRLEAECGTDG